MSTPELDAALELVKSSSELLRTSELARSQLRSQVLKMSAVLAAAQKYIQALELNLSPDELEPYRQAYGKALLSFSHDKQG